MIESRAKNQRATRDIIEAYQREFVDELHRELELQRFIKYFAKHIMVRVEQNDCYFVDMLEDIERLDN